MKSVWCWAGPTSRVLAHKPPTRRNLSQKLSDDVFFYSCPDAQMPPKKDDKKDDKQKEQEEKKTAEEVIK